MRGKLPIAQLKVLWLQLSEDTRKDIERVIRTRKQLGNQALPEAVLLQHFGEYIRSQGHNRNRPHQRETYHRRNEPGG